MKFFQILKTRSVKNKKIKKKTKTENNKIDSQLCLDDFVIFKMNAKWTGIWNFFALEGMNWLDNEKKG